MAHTVGGCEGISKGSLKTIDMDSYYLYNEYEFIFNLIGVFKLCPILSLLNQKQEKT